MRSSASRRSDGYYRYSQWKKSHKENGIGWSDFKFKTIPPNPYKKKKPVVVVENSPIIMEEVEVKPEPIVDTKSNGSYAIWRRQSKKVNDLQNKIYTRSKELDIRQTEFLRNSSGEKLYEVRTFFSDAERLLSTIRDRQRDRATLDFREFTYLMSFVKSNYTRGLDLMSSVIKIL